MFSSKINSPPSTGSDTMSPPPYVSLMSPFEPPKATEPMHIHYTSNLPVGFFLIRNRSSPVPRCLDVIGRGGKGTEIGAHPVKEPFIPRGSSSLQNQYNNQLFYMDWDGHIQSASAEGCAIDCTDQDLFLSLPPPIFSIPSRQSHPLPRFQLDPTTRVLFVRFSHDPTFPGPKSSSHDWTKDDYIVETVPIQKAKSEDSVWTSVANTGTGFLSGLGAGLFSKLPITPSPTRSSFAQQVPPSSTKAPVRPPWEASTPHSRTLFERNDYDPLFNPLPSSTVHPNSPLFQAIDMVPNSDGDSDNEDSGYRPIRVVKLQPGWREKFPRAALAKPNYHTSRKEPKHVRLWRRRQWDVISVGVKPIEGGLGTVNPPIPNLPSIPALATMTSITPTILRDRSNEVLFAAEGMDDMDDLVPPKNVHQKTESNTSWNGIIPQSFSQRKDTNALGVSSSTKTKGKKLIGVNIPRLNLAGPNEINLAGSDILVGSSGNQLTPSVQQTTFSRTSSWSDLESDAQPIDLDKLNHSDLEESSRAVVSTAPPLQRLNSRNRRRAPTIAIPNPNNLATSLKSPTVKLIFDEVTGELRPEAEEEYPDFSKEKPILSPPALPRPPPTLAFSAGVSLPHNNPPTITLGEVPSVSTTTRVLFDEVSGNLVESKDDGNPIVTVEEVSTAKESVFNQRKQSFLEDINQELSQGMPTVTVEEIVSARELAFAITTSMDVTSLKSDNKSPLDVVEEPTTPVSPPTILAIEVNESSIEETKSNTQEEPLATTPASLATYAFDSESASSPLNSLTPITTPSLSSPTTSKIEFPRKLRKTLTIDLPAANRDGAMEREPRPKTPADDVWKELMDVLPARSRKLSSALTKKDTALSAEIKTGNASSPTSEKSISPTSLNRV